MTLRATLARRRVLSILTAQSVCMRFACSNQCFTAKKPTFLESSKSTSESFSVAPSDSTRLCRRFVDMQKSRQEKKEKKREKESGLQITQNLIYK